MTAEKLSKSSTATGATTADLCKNREADEQNNVNFTSNRSAWLSRYIVVLLLITIASLAIGLGLGIKSNGTSFSNTENVSRLAWPELVGMDAENASAWMKENYPEYNVYVVNYGEYVTEDHDTKRVRIYRAPNGTVYTVPKIGR
jgi:Potato inhibitor I family